ncbi:hypothetical protein [Actinomyces sp. 565]|uniref:hypothetical protein n=1 Tax=Actinomyces sp. 565 TaxID=2057794 RepID=UPI0013A69717|nr:hypothetical protein [Actinomyces sp. 565]NDR52590.1 hypothetical protein [Actinomyces sp. 565]
MRSAPSQDRTPADPNDHRYGARRRPRSRAISGAGRAVLVGFVLCAAGRALLIPLFGSADEVNHLDYAFQLWHGQWPDFFTGPVIPGSGPRTPLSVQSVSQHPPLFYLIMAPLAGGLTDWAGVLAAGLAARALNVLLGAAAVAVIGYAAQVAFPRNRLLAPTTMLIAALCCSMLGVSGAVYNDTLATLLMAACLALTCQFIRQGPTRRRWLLLAVLGCAALLTRLSLMVVVAVCMLAIVLEGMVRGAGRDRWGRWTALLNGAGVGVLVALSAGWFYLRNLRLTGTITGGHPEWAAEHFNTHQVPVSELAARPETWQRLLSLFVPVPALGGVGLVLIAAPAACGLAAGVVALVRRRATGADLAVAGVLGLEAVLIVAMQLKYSAGGGGLHPRYLLPALLTLAVLMAGGLTCSRWLAGIATGAWFALWAVFFVPWWWQQAQQGAAAPAGGFPAWPGPAIVLLGAALVAWTIAVVRIGRLGGAAALSGAE